jgi:ribosomal-protein-alanine N-acetyltransferase
MPLPNASAPGAAVFGPARRDELESLAVIDRGSPRPWTLAAFENELGNSPPTVFALRSFGNPIAFVVTRRHPPELDIVNLAVAEEHRKRGFGRILLGFLLEMARRDGVEQVFLEVRAGNRAALGLYRSLGFEETQKRRNFYADPVEDAILMKLKIEP